MPSVRDRNLDLLAVHRLAGVRQFRAVGPLAPVGAPDRDRFQRRLRELPRRNQLFDQLPRLVVERFRGACADIVHHDADRRGLDHGLQVGAGPPLLIVGARVVDRRRRLRREHQQDFLVLVVKRLAALLIRDEEVADMRASIEHRRSEIARAHDEVRRIAERADVARQVRQPERLPKAAQMLEQPQPVGPPVHHVPFLFRRDPRGNEVVRRSRFVDGRDAAIARAGQRTGAVDGLLQHRAQIEARADAQYRRIQVGEASSQHFHLTIGVVVSVHWRVL